MRTKSCWCYSSSTGPRRSVSGSAPGAIPATRWWGRSPPAVRTGPTIGATVVHLVKVEGHVLTVEGLDVWEGAPVLDIKPEQGRDAVDLGCSEGKD